MSAFGGKADIGWRCRCLLLTQSGHERLRIAVVQTDPSSPFRRSQFPAVIADVIGVVLSLEEGDATTRFHQSNCWFSGCMAARCARAAEQAQGHTARRRPYALQRERSPGTKPQRGVSAGPAAIGLDRRA